MNNSVISSLEKEFEFAIQCLRLKRPKEYVCFRLHDQGYTTNEGCKKLNLTKYSYRKRVVRAQSFIKKHLQKRYISFDDLLDGRLLTKETFSKMAFLFPEKE
jgi:hypothetical protein